MFSEPLKSLQTVFIEETVLVFRELLFSNRNAKLNHSNFV